MKQPYLIMGLPRSRSAWLANFLTYGKSFCLHEPLIGCRSMSDLRQKLNELPVAHVGAADTMLPPVIDAALAEFPDAKIVVLLRKADGFAERMHKIGMDDAQIEWLVEAFDYACEQVKHIAMFVRSDDLDDKSVVWNVWKHLGIDGPFPRLRFEALVDVRVEALIDRVTARVEMHTDDAVALLTGGT